MTRILGFLSEKIPDRAKITALLSLELRALLFSFSLIMICIEAYQAVVGSTLPRGPFALTAVLAFFSYSQHRSFHCFRQRSCSSFCKKQKLLSFCPPPRHRL